ncbi:MAG: phosphate ABC transporter substrate-binding protein PstS family protein [Syntrophomonadaceae bacterium]|nr:phosphate ABC transporter substrate-binding protein PstS family protein [Syntrophomonadaceae bacterium]
MISTSLRRTTSFIVLVFLLLTAALVSGCGSKAEDQVKEDGEKTAQQLSGKLTIAGSTSIQPFSEVLVEKFREQNPQVQINVQGGGSSQGVEAAKSGAADIGSSSRELKEEEKPGLVENKIALDGIAIIVNSANKLTALKMEDVKNIYLGNIKNWKEVGGEDAVITVVCREAGSGTRGAFEDIVMEKQSITNKVIIQNSTGAVRTTVAGDPQAIGFVSLASLNQDVKGLKIDGAEPSEANIKNGSYKISRPFLYLTKEQPNALAKGFIEFVLSDEGQQVLIDEGAISIK